MSRETMKELVRANTTCTDEATGRWLAHYEKDRLDAKRRTLFVEHLGECLQCMALYNIETKHKYGYLDAEQTRARRVKVMLLEWQPPCKHILAALSLLVVVISCATHTKYWCQSEIGTGFEIQTPELSVVQVSRTPLRKEQDATDLTESSKYPQEHATRRCNDLSLLRRHMRERVVRPASTPEMLGGADDLAREGRAGIAPAREEQRPEVKTVRMDRDEVAKREVTQPNDVSNGTQPSNNDAPSPPTYDEGRYQGARRGT